MSWIIPIIGCCCGIYKLTPCGGPVSCEHYPESCGTDAWEPIRLTFSGIVPVSGCRTCENSDNSFEWLADPPGINDSQILYYVGGVLLGFCHYRHDETDGIGGRLFVDCESKTCDRDSFFKYEYQYYRRLVAHVQIHPDGEIRVKLHWRAFHVESDPLTYIDAVLFDGTASLGDPCSESLTIDNELSASSCSIGSPGGRLWPAALGGECLVEFADPDHCPGGSAIYSRTAELAEHVGGVVLIDEGEGDSVWYEVEEVDEGDPIVDVTILDSGNSCEEACFD